MSYVHCAQGYRPTALIARLLADKGLARELGEGMKLVRSVRPRMRLNGLQAFFVDGYLKSGSDE